MFVARVKPTTDIRVGRSDSQGRERIRSSRKLIRAAKPSNPQDFERMMANHKKVCEENIMLHEYFDVFERRYVESKRQLEVLSKQNQQLKNTVKLLTGATRSRSSNSMNGYYAKHLPAEDNGDPYQREQSKQPLVKHKRKLTQQTKTFSK